MDVDELWRLLEERDDDGYPTSNSSAFMLRWNGTPEELEAMPRISMAEAQQRMAPFVSGVD